MVSLSITIWRGQSRVSAREGFSARPPRAERGRNSSQWDCMSANSRLPQDKINLFYGHEELIFNEILLGRNIILGG